MRSVSVTDIRFATGKVIFKYVHDEVKRLSHCSIRNVIMDFAPFRRVNQFQRVPRIIVA